MDEIKRKHKDTIFRELFKEPRNFLHLLEWCRGGESGLTVEDITPFDLDSELALRIRRNDVSFITKENRLIILVEHQSTQCPNMAFRLFLYYIELMQLWVKLNDVNLYGESHMLALPMPEFYVAYNGAKPLKSDYSTFVLEHEGIKIDVKVKIVDIHFEGLADIMPANTLAGYAFFYKVYDDGIRQGMTREAAFSAARDECIKQGYLRGYVEKEDFIVFYKDILDYDTQLRQEGKAEGKAEGKVEGKAEGKVEGLLEAAANLLKKGLDLQFVAETLNLSDPEIVQLKKSIA